MPSRRTGLVLVQVALTAAVGVSGCATASRSLTDCGSRSCPNFGLVTFGPGIDPDVGRDTATVLRAIMDQSSAALAAMLVGPGGIAVARGEIARHRLDAGLPVTVTEPNHDFATLEDLVLRFGSAKPELWSWESQTSDPAKLGPWSLTIVVDPTVTAVN